MLQCLEAVAIYNSSRQWQLVLVTGTGTARSLPVLCHQLLQFVVYAAAWLTLHLQCHWHFAVALSIQHFLRVMNESTSNGLQMYILIDQRSAIAWPQRSSTCCWPTQSLPVLIVNFNSGQISCSSTCYYRMSFTSKYWMSFVSKCCCSVVKQDTQQHSKVGST